MPKKRGYRSREARIRRHENRLARARGEISRLAFQDRINREAVNLLGFAELADNVSRSTARMLYQLDIHVGEILSDSRGEGSFQRVGT